MMDCMALAYPALLPNRSIARGDGGGGVPDIEGEGQDPVRVRGLQRFECLDVPCSGGNMAAGRERGLGDRFAESS